jgi:hypothetical protein
MCGAIADAVATTLLIDTCDGSRVLAWSQTQMGHGTPGRSEPFVVDGTTRPPLEATGDTVRLGVASTSTWMRSAKIASTTYGRQAAMNARRQPERRITRRRDKVIHRV